MTGSENIQQLVSHPENSGKKNVNSELISLCQKSVPVHIIDQKWSQNVPEGIIWSQCQRRSEMHFPAHSLLTHS